jgi:hypothetical protein
MTSAMCRRLIPPMLAVACAFLPACAGNHAAVVSDSRTPVKPLSRPAAIAYAHAVNLTAADLPGFKVSSEHAGTTAGERRLEREMLACAGPIGQPTPTAGADNSLADVGSKGFEFKRGIVELTVSSEVAVSSTPAVAAGELTAIRSAHVRACFSHYLNLLFKSQRHVGASVGRVSIASGTPPAPGTAGGFGWRITARLMVSHVELPLYMDVLGFVDGPARVTLFSSGALRPFPAGAQQRLFELLLGRARAHTP